ncbi:uncharacterized protein PgNI_08843 [Pyricularia grisea]|uniref:Uncharacterized protein n=1 Tax=Pyricularia grisea TaxID=148305 RepID=A0A6P8AV96_PYRGI|nr:uncharacterized protein PgNI_08843 [Pyricularia grisea]TLD06084.1 hypothetical protein PgNI_08843 [Pyricularia grisea]
MCGIVIYKVMLRLARGSSWKTDVSNPHLPSYYDSRQPRTMSYCHKLQILVSWSTMNLDKP